MTLYEYLQNTTDFEITVFDKDYDIEVYFYKTDKKDDWDRAMDDLAKSLMVVDMDCVTTRQRVTVNLSEVIENKIDELKKADLFFIDCNIDAIMDDMQNILAGCVSTEWLKEFVKVIRK